MKTTSNQKQTEKILSFTAVANCLSTMPDSILHPFKEQKEFALKMPNRVTKVISIILMGSGLLLGGISQSYATTDSKVYPGSMCVRADADGPNPYLYGSRMYNPSRSRDLKLQCPVVRDRADKIKNAWVRLADMHSKKDICPQLVEFRHVNNSVFSKVISSSPQCSNGISNEMRSFNFGNFKTAEDSNVYIKFTIPRAELGISGVGTYRVREHTGSIFQTKD